VFFLGLLSTPLPYLLLAAFYFFGFAMGMFNNSNGDEPIETVSAVTIPVEIKQKTIDQHTFYFEVNPIQLHQQSESTISKDSYLPYFPDTGTTIFISKNSKVPDNKSTSFRFSRPPPSV